MPGPRPLLSLRTAVILALAAITGAMAGSLTYLSDPSAPKAVLAGGAAGGAALLLFHSLIGDDQEKGA
jgi:hypothetical protein